jgi:hypothetical protein
MRWLLILATAACGSDGAQPLFRADYATTYTEVRNCRASADHDLHKIRIVANPIALDAYTTRSAPFPDDSIVVKEEYDFTDGDCGGAIVEWTVMKKVAGAWRWQRVDADRSVIEEDDASCIGCHAQCGRAPDGHDGTCAVP